MCVASNLDPIVLIAGEAGLDRAMTKILEATPASRNFQSGHGFAGDAHRPRRTIVETRPRMKLAVILFNLGRSGFSGAARPACANLFSDPPDYFLPILRRPWHGRSPGAGRLWHARSMIIWAADPIFEETPRQEDCQIER